MKNVFHSGCYINGSVSKWDYRLSTMTRASYNLEIIYEELMEELRAFKDGKQKV